MLLFWQKKFRQPTSSSPSIILTLLTLSILISFYTRLGESSVLTEMEKPGKPVFQSILYLFNKFYLSWHLVRIL